MIWKLSNLIEYCTGEDRVESEINGKYVPARPLSLPELRLKAAWKVLKGEADAVVWPEGQ